MTEQELKQFEPLWTTDKSRYVLKIGRTYDGDPDGCLIFDKVSSMVQLIEDEPLASEVKRRMAKAGVPIVDALPVNIAEGDTALCPEVSRQEQRKRKWWEFWK